MDVFDDDVSVESTSAAVKNYDEKNAAGARAQDIGAS